MCIGGAQRDKATLLTVSPSLSLAISPNERKRDRNRGIGKGFEEVDISRGENLNKTRKAGGERVSFSLFSSSLFRYRDFLSRPSSTTPSLKKCKFSKWKLVENPGQCEPPPPPPCPQHLRSEYRFSPSPLLGIQLIRHTLSLCSLALPSPLFNFSNSGEFRNFSTAPDSIDEPGDEKSFAPKPMKPELVVGKWFSRVFNPMV